MDPLLVLIGLGGVAALALLGSRPSSSSSTSSSGSKGVSTAAISTKKNPLVTQYGTGIENRGTRWTGADMGGCPAFMPDRQLTKEERLQNAHIIANVAQLRGLSPAWAAAMIVNARYESDLDHRAAGDADKKDGCKFTSYGLFQMHHSYKAAKGKQQEHGDAFSIAERTDPIIASNAMIDEAFRNVGKKVRGLENWGPVPPPPTDAKGLTAWWCEWVERPANRKVKSAERVRAYQRMFPNGVPSRWPSNALT